MAVTHLTAFPWKMPRPDGRVWAHGPTRAARGQGELDLGGSGLGAHKNNEGLQVERA